MAKTLPNIPTFKHLRRPALEKMAMAMTFTDADELYVKENHFAVSLKCTLYSSAETGFLQDGPFAIPPKGPVRNYQTRIGNPIVL
jgi:hypothetical protein